ncbi:MAG: isochorismatase family protein [Pseudomonadota bacterium]
MSLQIESLCCAQNSQLIIVDVQKNLGQAMPTKVLNRVVLNTVLLASGAELLGVPILLTEQYPQGLGPTDDNILAVLNNHQRFEKTSFSATGASGFSECLMKNERKQVILVGMEAHVCVLQTALSLQAEGYQVFVVEDAICSRRLENYQNALDRLRQLAVHVVSAESVTFEWLGDASHEHFKEIQRSLR